MMLIIEFVFGVMLAIATVLACSFPEKAWEIMVAIPSMIVSFLKVLYNKDGGIWFSIIFFGLFSLSLLLFPGLAHWLYFY